MNQSNRVHQLKKTPKKQQGLVMLMVVGIVVLMITLLALMLEDQHVMIRQIGNQRIADQSYHYSEGLNAWALRVLHEDENPLIDFEGEKWAKFGRPEPEPSEDEADGFSLDPTLRLGREPDEEEAKIDFGIDTVEVTIDDLQARYNLNNLVILNDEKYRPQPNQRQIFLNLLAILEIGEFQEDRTDMYSALIDWMDDNKDLNGIGNGAESSDYQIRSTPYFASDQPLTSVGELKYVKGFTQEVIRKLRPHVTVLPVHNSRLNLNTVSAEVLSSLAGGPVSDASVATGFLGRKQQPGFQGFQRADISQAETVINGAVPGGRGTTRGMLGVNSQFFQINTKVELGDRKVCTRTVVLRKLVNQGSGTRGGGTDSGQKISVLSREQDTVCKEEEAEQSGEETANDEDIR